MQLFLLVTPNMEPIPKDIKVVEDYGFDTIVLGRESNKPDVIPGRVMYLEGETNLFIEWLTPFGGIWIRSLDTYSAWYVVHFKTTKVSQATSSI